MSKDVSRGLQPTPRDADVMGDRGHTLGAAVPALPQQIGHSIRRKAGRKERA